MKKIFITIFIANIILIAQTEQKDVELPDFVITGRQKIDVQTVEKKKADFIGIVSEDFLMPRYSPEELPLLISAVPKPIIPSVDDLNNSYFGNIYVGLGKYTYPVGELHLNKSMNYYLLHADVWGLNIKEYIPYSGYNSSGVNLENNLFVSTKSDFLPGSEIKLNGKYFRDSYKFFGSLAQDSLRENFRTNGNFSFSNNYNKWINAGLNLQVNLLTIKNSLKEKLLSGSGYFETKAKQFTLGTKALYKKQFLENNLSGIDNYSYYELEAYSKLYSLKNIILNFGVNYSKNNDDKFFSPFASAEVKLYNGLTLKAEFTPHTEFYSINDLLNKNIYMNNDSIDNVFMKVPFNLNASLKYDYENLLTVKLWGNYRTINHYPFFEDRIKKGFFNIYSVDEVKSYSIGTDILFNSSFYGFLDFSFMINQVKDKSDNYIPYNPLYQLNISYGYNFYFGLGFKIKYKFYKDYYADSMNKKLIPDYHDFSASLMYDIFKSLSLRADFHNIFNKSNFVFEGYREKPFDIILGIEYRWQ